MSTFDLSQISSSDAYRLLISTIIPRPIAFVSTVSPDGVSNLAPFSFFNGVSSQPPALVISCTKKSTGEDKDTLKNILATGEFVVNSANEWLLDPLNQCAAEYPYGVSEFEKVGLTPLASAQVKPPRVKEAAVQMECRLLKTMDVGSGTLGSATLVVGQVLIIHVADEILDPQGKVDPHKLKPLTRLGGISYGKLGEIIDLPRPRIS